MVKPHISPPQRMWELIQARAGLPLLFPPFLMIAQVFLLLYIASLGFPDQPPEQKILVGCLISLMFAITFFALIGIAIGVNQLLVLKGKTLPLLGIACNGIYFLGFILFFIGIFVTNSTA
jgi:hypothetical protein